MLRFQSQQGNRVANFGIIGSVRLERGGLPAQNSGCCLLGARLAIAAGDADQCGFWLAQCARAGRCVQGLDDVWNDDLQEIGGNIFCKLAA